MSWKGIICQRHSPDTFERYVHTLTLPEWVQFCVLHNTSEPNLAQRPVGFTAAHMRNLESFYRDTQKWQAGPHLFIDDRGIWLFTPLTLTGVHSPSWNACSWGLEMLGEYEDEAFSTGRGALVRDNAVAALATLCNWAKLDSQTIRFHKEDPKTTHTSCPGRHVDKADVIKRVHDLIVMRRGAVAVK